MRPVTLLVVAKAPVAGQAKTRLAEDLGGRPHLAADLAAASLLDTVRACTDAAGAAACRLALAGDLGAAARGAELAAALDGWTLVEQHGRSLGERLATALSEVDGPVVQVGMDTPQVTPILLHDLQARLVRHDAVLAPATDGGWWALGLRDGRTAAPLASVPMSTASAYADTRAALEASGLRVVEGPMLTDVDHVAEMWSVALLAGHTRFGRCVRELLEEVQR
ncbi:MAG TPA: DUF2064 domain-containing protein [Marmoricola sp.]